MKFSTLLTAAGVLALVFGLGFLIAPGQVLALYGATTNPIGLQMSRFCGVALINLGLVLFLAREVTDPTAQHSIALGSFLGSLAGLAVALWGKLSGLSNALGWSTVAIYLLLALGYATFLFGRQQVRTAEC
jgi:uncharacterized protein YjeT (DUF2065 family)